MRTCDLKLFKQRRVIFDCRARRCNLNSCLVRFLRGRLAQIPTSCRRAAATCVIDETAQQGQKKLALAGESNRRVRVTNSASFKSPSSGPIAEGREHLREVPQRLQYSATPRPSYVASWKPFAPVFTKSCSDERSEPSHALP